MRIVTTEDESKEIMSLGCRMHSRKENNITLQGKTVKTFAPSVQYNKPSVKIQLGHIEKVICKSFQGQLTQGFSGMITGSVS